MKTMTIKIDDDLHAKLQAVAEREERSMSNAARMAMREGIDRFFLGKVSKHQEAAAV